MTISIVVTTYNGSKYISEQLKSLQNQTRRADEVLLFDDGSIDGTQKIICDFIRQNHLSNWFFHQNTINLGWCCNYMQGFQSSSGDLVFPCDQDDIWERTKVEEMYDIMIHHAEANVLCCNIEPFSSDGKHYYIADFNLNNYGKRILEKVKFGNMWMNVMRQGCTMCFRRTFMRYIEKVWFEQCPHDMALWAAGMATDSLYIYNRQLVRFRRHEGNSTPSNRKSKYIRTEILEKSALLGKNILSASFKEAKGNEVQMKKMISFYEEREKFIQTKRLSTGFHLLTELKMYPQKRAFLGDIVSTFR